MKIDHDEHVNELFSAKLKVEKGVSFDISQKKFAFKLINDNKDRQNKANVDQLWKSYMLMQPSEEEKKKKGFVQKPLLVTSKAQLIEIIEDLERDNLVMYEPSDGTVILI